jgi:hypothetical protein
MTQERMAFRGPSGAKKLVVRTKDFMQSVNEILRRACPESLGFARDLRLLRRAQDDMKGRVTLWRDSAALSTFGSAMTNLTSLDGESCGIKRDPRRSHSERCRGSQDGVEMLFSV